MCVTKAVKHTLNLALINILVVVLAACSTAASPTPTPPATIITDDITDDEPPAPTATLAPTIAPTPEGPIYDNPVYDNDFPDPHVLRVDDTYYAYATNTSNSNIPVLRSTDLAVWERLGDALPALPEWASPNQGLTWAPGAIQIGETFVLYYTTRDTTSDKQCISLAVGDSPEGPFVDDSAEPFICQADLGGSIDPYPFLDESGTLYLFWKNDGNCCGLPVGLWVQQLSEDGLSLVGEPTELIQRDQAWERPLIENPAMVEVDDAYYLFYSGNWWESHEYAVGYAVCETITGPCEKPLTEPLFTFGNGAMGPGGQSFFTDTDGDLLMAYHAWTGVDVGYPAGERSLRIEPVTFEDGRPLIPGPTTDPQPLP
jgi:beta-xylosidase